MRRATWAQNDASAAVTPLQTRGRNASSPRVTLPQTRSRNGSPAGVTLLELLIVMAILTLVAGLFPIALERIVPARRLAAAAQELVLHIRDLQTRAVGSGQALSLELEGTGYSLQEMTADALRNDPGARATRPIKIPLPVEVTLTLVSGDAGGTLALVMYPDGSSSGGTFELKSGNRLARVWVSQLTGHVRVVS